MCKLPYPIAIAAGRSLEEPSLRAVVPPEARRPPPRVAELARVRVARVTAVGRGIMRRSVKIEGQAYRSCEREAVEARRVSRFTGALCGDRHTDARS